MPAVYVDRQGRNTSQFTKDIQAHVSVIENQGGYIVSVVPNAGLTETVGVWIFWRTGARE